MAMPKREGLRVKLKTDKIAKLKTTTTNADMCKQYRERLKCDPERQEIQRLKDIERNRRNRTRPKTEEKKAAEREHARLRMQKYRQKRKNEQEAEDYVNGFTSTAKPKTRATIQKDAAKVQAKRQKWADYKRQQREKWDGHKWRRHREANKKCYHKRMEQKKRGIF